jgi:hypothetical protein
MNVTFQEQHDATSLLSRYARSLDAADVAAVLECFTDDISLSYEDGRIVVTGREDAEAFLRSALRSPSTHLLSNYGFERMGDAIVVTCSAIACVCRKEGLVTIRGLVYVFSCVPSASGLRVQKLQHSLKWQCDAPSGLPSR